MNETSIAQAGTNYRKGVIFGLTMAEILLLLIFCLLLFITTLNKKINEYEKQEIILQNQNQEYLTSIQMLEEKNSQYQKNIKTLKNQNSLYQNNLNALGKSTSVPQKVYDVVEKMNDEELFKFVENSEIASTVSSVDFKKIFEKAEKWDIATNQPQNLDVNKITDFAKTLSPKELSKLNLLLNQTGELAKIGGWELDLQTNLFYFTDEMWPDFDKESLKRLLLRRLLMI